MVEFKIIAIDAENNKKQVTVVLDAKKIAQDREVLKQSRKIERAKKLEVTNDGSVKLNSINEEGKIDKIKTEVINDIKDIDKLVKTIEPDEFLNLEAKFEKENGLSRPPSSYVLFMQEQRKIYDQQENANMKMKNET